MIPQHIRDKDRRASLFLLQYWNELRGDRPFPTEDEIDEAVLAPIWGHCFLIQVRDIEQVKDYNYTYFGHEIMDAYQLGLLKPDNGQMVAPDANMLAPIFMKVLETKDPMLDQGEYINQFGSVVKFRQSLMPLGREKGKVDSLIGAAGFIIKSA